MAAVAAPTRRRPNGTTFEVGSPDVTVGLIEFASGALGRLTANFFVHKQNSKQRGIEFHGEDGSLFLGCWQSFDAPVEVARYGEPFRTLPPARAPYEGTDWGRGIVEMAEAIASGLPHRVTGQHAAHVTEILCALDQSRRDSRFVQLGSTFSPPAPMDWTL
jgi:predicted dehydrogenase